MIAARTDEANQLVVKLTKQKHNNARDCSELALILNKLKRYSAAQEYYQQAIVISPNDPQLHFNLASIQRYQGEIDKAELSLNKTIQLNPKDYEAYWLRSSLRKQTIQNNHIEEMKGVLVKGINHPIGHAQICYALAKEQEDLQNFAQSFEYLKRGADNRRANMRYEPDTDLQIINKIVQVFDSNKLNSKNGGYDNDEAIFILGLPRTGSTLAERIISSHEEVYSAGELNNFALEMMSQCRELQKELPKSRTALVELTSQIDFAKLGQDYIQSTRPGTERKNRFIDKLPLNSLYVGLIHLALPKAKVIHVQRHPLDTCYSIYKQLFTNGYPFSYNLTELANYYVAHHNMMQHWKKVAADQIYTVSYEALVNDVELQSKKLIDYCDLEWQDQCSQFHLNKDASVTASATQVRQSIYSSSVNKWRSYKDELEPVKNILERAGISCD